MCTEKQSVPLTGKEIGFLRAVAKKLPIGLTADIVFPVIIKNWDKYISEIKYGDVEVVENNFFPDEPQPAFLVHNEYLLVQKKIL